MSFRLGEKTKKALRIGSKVGSIGLAVALGTKGAKDTKAQRQAEGVSLGKAQLQDIAQTGKAQRQITQLATRPAPPSQTLPRETKAVSNKPAIARAVVGGATRVALAKTPEAKAGAGVRAVQSVRAVKPSVEANVEIKRKIAEAERQAKARTTPAVPLGGKSTPAKGQPKKQPQAGRPQGRRGMTERLAGGIRGGAPTPKSRKRR